MGRTIYQVESLFEHEGLQCAVLRLMELGWLGWRCGYVAVPKGHPLYQVKYNDDWENDHSLLAEIRVHGGLTYSSIPNSDDRFEYPIETESDLWWFGFDCNHAYDMPEYGGSYKDTHYVESECRRLAEQLSKVKEVQS